MRKMGLEAIYPKPKLSLASSGHKIYPYLLRGLEIGRNNQVWSTDITYMRLRQGFIYLVAIPGSYIRLVLTFRACLGNIKYHGGKLLPDHIRTSIATSAA